jgi:hypothetical protein
MIWIVLLEVWLAWAFIALIVTGIAKIARNDDLTTTMVHSLRWKLRR